jgi:hypothetical protein
VADDVVGRPAAELSDEELERQGTHAHATRNWVFLHGSAEQFARHTSRMLELEREYVRRHPKRTWQGSGGAPADPEATAVAWRETLLGVIRQLESLVEVPDPRPAPPEPGADPAEAFLLLLAAAGGSMHKLEAHQAAREAGLDRAALADLYRADPPFVTAAGDQRLLTERGRERLPTPRESE